MGSVSGMSNFQQKLTELVNSPQAKKLTDKVQAFADDPKTKEQVEKAKRKLAEMRQAAAPAGPARHPTARSPPDRLKPAQPPASSSNTTPGM